MYRVPPTVVALCLLGGCGTGQFGPMQTATHNPPRTELAKCRARWPDEKKKPVTPYVRCLNAANRKWIAAAESVNSDLVEVSASYRIALARRYDRGELSWTAYQFHVAEKRAELQTIRIARLNQIKRANAAADRADAAQRRVFEKALAKRTRDQAAAKTTFTNCRQTAKGHTCTQR